jgi:hypothetical protein
MGFGNKAVVVAHQCHTAASIVLLLFLCLSSGNAQLLDYGTFAGYGLKKGILGNDYTHPLAACVTGNEEVLNASHANVRASIAYSASEYEHAFHIDQNAKATFLEFGGGDELHIGHVTGSSGSAFDIILEAYAEHESNTINNISWDSPYAEMVKSEDPSQIQKVRLACGDRYIQTVFNEARLFAVLHVSSTQASALTAFGGKVNGNMDIGIASASDSLGGDDKVQSARKAGAITVEIQTEGLGGLIPTAGAIGIASEDGLAGIAAKLAQYLASLKETGQPVKYQLTPLPGISTGKLSDTHIFDYLRDLKSYYSATNSRLRNVKSLAGNDPRRILYKQPQANHALDQQKALLAAYLDAVAAAHDDCRKASTLSVCSKLAKKVGTPPPMASVELPEATSPVLGEFIVSIDGTPVPPGQYRIILNPGTTLLEAAKTLQPTAENVDVLAPIDATTYLSYIEVGQPSFDPSSTGMCCYRRLLAQNFEWPEYWKAAGIGTSSLHVLHADAQHPCKITLDSILELAIADEGCLTRVGRVIWDAALLEAADRALDEGPILGFAHLMQSPGMDCLGQPFFVRLGFIRIDRTPNGQANKTVTTSIELLGGLMMIAKQESHDQQTWRELAKSRQAALLEAAHDPTFSLNACVPRIP